MTLLRKTKFYLKNQAFIAFSCVAKSLKQNRSWSGLWKKVLPREVQKLTSTIEEKDATIALLNDDLQNRECENVALQAQNVYQDELQKCQDTITHLKTRYIPHARNPGKDNIIIIVRKHTTSANDKYHDLSYLSRGYNDVKGMLS